MLLLAASYYFYGSWRWDYLILIVLSTLIDYTCGLWLDSEENPVKRKIALGMSLFTNLGVLVVFKYLDLFIGTANSLFESTGSAFSIPYMNLLLPVGISFYSFQTLSYTIDVYRREMKAERHFGYFALYVTYFPQLVAGPIERADRLLPSLRETHAFSPVNLSAGFKLMAWGFFKKIVLADRLGILVDQIYGAPESYNGFPLVLATVAFAFQIYCDFSGYSDIARGAARMMGVELMINFKAPYLSRSISEFWSRWHISLSTWFRDYLYIPLGGNRRSNTRVAFNIFVVFLLSGLWHGANYTFLAWGAVHGSMLLFQRSVGGPLWGKYHSWKPAITGWFEWAVTFAAVNVAWVFFRADSVEQALYVIAHLADSPGYVLSLVPDLLTERSFLFRLGLPQWEFYLALAGLTILVVVDRFAHDGSVHTYFDTKPRWIRHGFYAGLVLFTLMFGQFVPREFIYFQF